jgi:hypothetical protein
METGADEIDFDSAASILAPPLPPNVDEFTLARNRKTNAKRWKYLTSGWTGIDEVALLCGGPSMNVDWELIRDLKMRGVQIACVNGSAKWANDFMLWPTFQFVVDARAINVRFTQPVIPGTWYLIADHCAPEILAHLPESHTFIWNPKDFRCGSTVALCAIPILKAMGIKKLHLFGFDSCMPVTGMHHAYPQPQNDGEAAIWTPVNGRDFLCTHWMIQQAEEFLEMYPSWGEFEIYGDGLLAHLIRTR